MTSGWTAGDGRTAPQARRYHPHGPTPLRADDVAMVVSGPLFVISRNRLGELGEPQRRILRLRPSQRAALRT